MKKLHYLLNSRGYSSKCTLFSGQCRTNIQIFSTVSLSHTVLPLPWLGDTETYDAGQGQEEAETSHREMSGSRRLEGSLRRLLDKCKEVCGLLSLSQYFAIVTPSLSDRKCTDLIKLLSYVIGGTLFIKVAKCRLWKYEMFLPYYRKFCWLAISFICWRPRSVYVRNYSF